VCVCVCVQATGVELKKLLAEESVCFYVSPFVRSKQTFDRIRKAFHDEQVKYDMIITALKAVRTTTAKQQQQQMNKAFGYNGYI